MLFAKDSQVNVGGILATTLNLGTDEFMAGNYQLTNPGSGTIRYEGILNASGSVALIGNEVSNAGQVFATTVTLAAGNTIAIDLTGDNLIRARIEDAGLKASIEMGNALAGAFLMSPCSGSLVRTQVALKGGMASAATPISIALISLLVATALTPMIGLLPQAVMAGLLIALGIDLIDKWTLVQVGNLRSQVVGPKTARSDLFVVAIVVATTLFVDLATAVGVGVVLSLLSFVMNMAHSPIRRSYRATAIIPQIYDDIGRRRFIERHGKRISVLEIEGALFFGTANELENCVDALMLEGVVHVVLDMRRVKHIDATGARTLERINTKLTSRDGLLLVSYVDRERRHKKQNVTRKNVRKRSGIRLNWIKLTNLGTVRALGEGKFLHDIDSSIAYCEAHLARQMVDESDVTEMLAIHSPFIQGFDRHMLRQLRRYWARINYAKGAVVFEQGTPPNGVFLVTSGRVEVLINLPGTERKRKVQSLTAGSVFGEMALIDPKERSATIIAVEPTACYWMSSANFEQLKLEQSDIAFKLITDVAMIFAERLRATNTMLAEMEA